MMFRTGIIYMVTFLLITAGFNLCYAGSVTMSDEVQINGILRLVDSPLCFSDGSCQTSAVFSDGSAVWGQITGYIDNQIDLSEKFQTKEDKINKGVANGYAPLNSSAKLSNSYISDTVFKYVTLIPYSPVPPVWNKNSDIWIEDTSYILTVPLPFPANLSHYGQLVWTDNVGIYSDNVNGTYCNIGLFLDYSTTPICAATFSGVFGYATFNQQTITCNMTFLISGVHTIRVKHRSDNCSYGASPKGENSTTRSLSLTLIQRAI